MSCVYLQYDSAVFCRLLREPRLLDDLRLFGCLQTVQRTTSDQGSLRLLRQSAERRANCSACKNASGICHEIRQILTAVHEGL